MTLILAACSGGSGELATVNNNPNNGGNNGGGGGGQTNPLTGKVTVTVKDAPLANLQSLTIDVSQIVLKGNGTPDVTVFPAMSGSTGTVNVDLLSLQGLNQILSSASIATGDYYAVDVTYANPAATDISGNAQNITTVGNRMLGLFSPALSVTSGSSQAIQVDIDLQRSYTDLGGNAGFLAPVVVVNVITNAVPLRRFPAFVQSVDVTNDRFEADLAFFGSGAPQAGNSGSVTVQCDSMTTFVDGQGNITTGMVTSNLMAGDLVEIDGSLLGGTVTASSVARYATTQPGGGNTGGGNNGGGNTGGGNTGGGTTNPGGILPPVVDLSGTIVGVNPMTNAIDILIDSISGPGTNLPQTFSTISLEVTSNSALHRGPITQTINDFVPGNYCYAFAQEVQRSGQVAFEALDVDEYPSLVTGTVVSATAGAGRMGADLLVLTPERVNQLPLSRLPFIPSPLKVDVPAGFSAQTGNTVSVFGFFDGTDYLISVGGSMGNPNTRPPTTGGGNTGGGGNPGGGTGGGSSVTFSGIVAANSQASLSSRGDVLFTLDVGGSGSRLNVTTLAAATMELIDVGAQRYTLSPYQASEVLNANPTAVEVVGSNVPNGTAFTADISLTIWGDPNSIPTSTTPPGSGNGGGGNTGGNPGGGNTGGGGSTTPGRDIIFGATANAVTGFVPLTFTLTTPNSSTSISVLMLGGAQLLLIDANNQTNAQPTLQELVTALNTQGTNAECVGTLNSSSNSFDCTVALTVIMARSTTGGGNPGGGNTGGGGSGPSVQDVAVGMIVGQAQLNTAGNITFTMTGVLSGSNSTATFTVTVGPNAMLFTASRMGGQPQQINAQQALAALNNRPASIQVEGDYDAQRAAFECNIALTIFQ